MIWNMTGTAGRNFDLSKFIMIVHKIQGNMYESILKVNFPIMGW